MIEKEKRAIQFLKAFEPKTEPYYLCYSGGKDSDVIRILASLAGVNHEIWHNHTTVDAPETVYYVRSIPNVNIRYSQKTMWQLIPEKKMPPLRRVRYCCAELKERGGRGRVKITGVRWAESIRRAQNSGAIQIDASAKKKADEIGATYENTKKGLSIILNDDNDTSRQLVDSCYRTASTMVNPIVDWSDADVWEFLKHYGCESNPLYKCGFSRIGCVGCPMATKKERVKQFSRWPKYKRLYVLAFDKMLAARDWKTKMNWKTGEDVFKWWMGDDPNQLSMFDDDDIDGALYDMGVRTWEVTK